MNKNIKGKTVAKVSIGTICGLVLGWGIKSSIKDEPHHLKEKLKEKQRNWYMEGQKQARKIQAFKRDIE